MCHEGKGMKKKQKAGSEVQSWWCSLSLDFLTATSWRGAFNTTTGGRPEGRESGRNLLLPARCLLLGKRNPREEGVEQLRSKSLQSLFLQVLPRGEPALDHTCNRSMCEAEEVAMQPAVSKNTRSVIFVMICIVVSMLSHGFCKGVLACPGYCCSLTCIAVKYHHYCPKQFLITSLTILK